MIPGIPQADSQQLLELIRSHPHVQKVVLYGSRALGRQRACDRMDRDGPGNRRPHEEHD